MKKILVIGAGLVSRPGVVFLLENGFDVTVASRTLEKAQKTVQGFENGKAVSLLVENQDELDALVKKNDIIVSLLPWTRHILVAKSCLKHNKPMATTSYVSEDMKKLDQEVKDKNLLFLNEIGVDPGIDHMSSKTWNGWACSMIPRFRPVATAWTSSAKNCWKNSATGRVKKTCSCCATPLLWKMHNRRNQPSLPP